MVDIVHKFATCDFLILTLLLELVENWRGTEDAECISNKIVEFLCLHATQARPPTAPASGL